MENNSEKVFFGTREKMLKKQRLHQDNTLGKWISLVIKSLDKRSRFSLLRSPW